MIEVAVDVAADVAVVDVDVAVADAVFDAVEILLDNEMYRFTGSMLFSKDHLSPIPQYIYSLNAILLLLF